MNHYRITIMKPARKFLEGQTRPQQERILKAICRLPREGDIKLLSGQENVYRLRVGSYRVIYSIHAGDNASTVEILTIGNRGDVYK